VHFQRQPRPPPWVRASRALVPDDLVVEVAEQRGDAARLLPSRGGNGTLRGSKPAFRLVGRSARRRRGIDTGRAHFDGPGRPRAAGAGAAAHARFLGEETVLAHVDVTVSIHDGLRGAPRRHRQRIRLRRRGALARGPAQRGSSYDTDLSTSTLSVFSVESPCSDLHAKAAYVPRRTSKNRWRSNGGSVADSGPPGGAARGGTTGAGRAGSGRSGNAAAGAVGPGEGLRRFPRGGSESSRKGLSCSRNSPGAALGAPVSPFFSCGRAGAKGNVLLTACGIEHEPRRITGRGTKTPLKVGSGGWLSGMHPAVLPDHRAGGAGPARSNRADSSPGTSREECASRHRGGLEGGGGGGEQKQRGRPLSCAGSRARKSSR